MRELAKKETIKDKFYTVPGWLSAEGWAVDKNNTRYRIGYVAYSWWWYEELGFRARRVYRDKEFIERNFKPITHLQEVKWLGVR